MRPRGKVVDTRIWTSTAFYLGSGSDQFQELKREWADKRYSIRTHKRTVRADGVAIEVLVAVVRDTKTPEDADFS